MTEENKYTSIFVKKTTAKRLNSYKHKQELESLDSAILDLFKKVKPLKKAK